MFQGGTVASRKFGGFGLGFPQIRSTILGVLFMGKRYLGSMLGLPYEVLDLLLGFRV